MKILLILRGVPGCGKSSLAQFLTPSSLFDTHIEADQYFINDDGEYNWDKEKLGAAHRDCLYRVFNAMEEGYHKIVVSNTSVREKDLKPYYELAEEHSYQVFSVIVENRHNGINKHSVPEDKLQSMEQALRSSIKLR